MHPDLQVTIKQGDTLIGLGQRWLADPRRWPELQRHNKIENPNRLVPGSTLAIPAALLREKPLDISVSAVSGDARRSDGSPIAKGDKLAQGASIRTEKNGYVTITLADGSSVRLQSESQLTVNHARASAGSEGTETQLQLSAGKAEVSVNRARPKETRFEIRTGFASAAVRGTAFRVSSDAGGTRTEVTEGTVALSGLEPDANAPRPENTISVPEGYGSLVDESRKPLQPVKLLGAPDLPKEPVFQMAPALKLAFPAMEGAVQYRAILAADAEFERIVGEATVTQPELGFAGLQAGSYVLKVRAADKFGLEGKDAIVLVGMVPATGPAPAAASSRASPAR